MITAYKITNAVNGLSYIGITGQSLKNRWLQHVSHSNKASTSLGRAIKKYGPSAFFYVKVAEAEDNESACLLERQLIAEHKTLTPSGYNLTTGGERIAGVLISSEVRAKMRESQLGRVHSEETKAKIGAAHKGRVSVNRGKKYSKPCGPERKAKIGAANKGRIRTPQAKINMSFAQLGRKLSEEAKNKIRLSKLGKPRPEHVRAKLAASNVGRVLSAETRRKLSAATKGKPRSPQHTANWLASIERRRDKIVGYRG